MEDDILQGFLEESWENLNQLDSDIVAFEKDTENDDLLASIFRTIHTIKGTCGFIGLTRIGAVSHATENVLGKMRDRSIERTTDGISLVLEGIDGIKELMQGLESSGEEPNVDHKELISHLEQVAEGKDAGQFVGNASQQEAKTTAQAGGTTEAGIDTATLMTESGDVDFDELDKAINEAAARHREKLAEQKKEEAKSPDAAPAGGKQAEKVVAKKGAVVEVDAQPSKKKTVADLSIRVNVNVLDRLMNLVGELVLARNQLIQLSRDDEESRYSAPITHLDRVTSDLQEGVMKTRMQPIGNAWSKLPRLVRDLARITEKQIELEMDGADTELDRTVLDAIKDPLTHMVRNSADHGVETTAERLAAGKSEKGTIHLDAYHEGGHVIICIEDDGAGINAERVLNKAIANGLVSEADAANLSDYDIHQFIFHPGLSTAEKVSSVSGRGVGMDVVRTEIERIGGTVDLLSKEGQGTTVRIKIPLTLAIISALVVKAGDQSFAIPQLGVVELVRLAADQRSRIERVHDKQVFRLRDRLLPLVELTDVLHMEPSCEKEDSDVNIVVVQVGEEQFGLVVDEVFDTEEIVVKPVGLLMKDIAIYQGTTILGDGRVIMILDVTGIASDFSALNATSTNRDTHVEEEKQKTQENTSLLVFDAGNETMMAVPLALVSRLEEFSRDDIEESSNGPIIQYRDCLLPLQSISGSFDSSQTTPQPVIVFSDGKKSMGLMVDGINDVVEEHLTIQVQSNRPGVLGTAVINGKATEVIDTQHYVEQTDPDWFQNKGTSHLRVLIVNSSNFFRQMLVTSLRAEKFQTEDVGIASDALSLLENDPRFDAIIVDFDDDAEDLTQWVHSQKQTSGIPVIGLCSRLTPPIQQRADESGCNALLEKLNISALSREIQNLCNQREWNQGVSA